MTFYQPQQAIIVASAIEHYLPPISKLREYSALCILEIKKDFCDIGLPKSLKSGQSMYFDNILFLIIGEALPRSLLRDLEEHVSQKNKVYGVSKDSGQ